MWTEIHLWAEQQKTCQEHCMQLSSDPHLPSAKTTENQTIDLVKWRVTATIAHSDVWLKGAMDSLHLSNI